MERRRFLTLTLLAGAGAALLPAGGLALAEPGCPTDGTPLQFVPKRPADLKAAEGDLEKYPKCPYCGMDRKQYHHSRVLVHYADDVADGTCSLHCAALSLALNVDRDPKAILVGDNAAAGELKPLVAVESATFLVGSALPGVMTKRSKVAYGTPAAAKAAQTTHGGELMSFEQVLAAVHADMAQDVTQIRKNRAERRKRALDARP